jgi:hypothetical protein
MNREINLLIFSNKRKETIKINSYDDFELNEELLTKWVEEIECGERIEILCTKLVISN